MFTPLRECVCSPCACMLAYDFTVLHRLHWDSSEPSPQSSCPLHFRVCEMQRPVLHKKPSSLHPSVEGKHPQVQMRAWGFMWWSLLGSERNPPQFSSSVPSPQSLYPSHFHSWGLHKPFLHFMWDVLQAESRERVTLPLCVHHSFPVQDGCESAADCGSAADQTSPGLTAGHLIAVVSTVVPAVTLQSRVDAEVAGAAELFGTGWGKTESESAPTRRRLLVWETSEGDVLRSDG